MSGFVQHPDASELRQRPDPSDEWWQDSVFVTWHAHDAGIGGTMRIGHEPHHAGGIAALWFGLVTADGQRYRRNLATRLTDGDRLPDGFGALGGRYRQRFDGRVRIEAVDDELELALEIEDFYPRTDFFPSDAGTVSDDFASAHFETSGRIVGHVRLGERAYEVDGLCHRDHSWGTRRWDTLLNHRWIPGTFGPELSFGSIAWHGVDGTVRQFGYLVRDGAVTRADAVDITVTFEPDGTTYRGGRAVWTMPDGERFAIDCAPIDATLSEHHGVAVVDAICPLERDGRRGFCDLEVSTNPRGGAGPITAALRANVSDGRSRRAAAPVAA
ncbi:DUF7065 domain-containing protein [Patulibacter defluvii]|uniref:DUF7065 domain-containing protein n=1 Tax=Patulibacter defluvii TaxID=3095358 RepID=UPI002A752A80|nr:hypothetical protein [Patulibacter sp. DM4]